MTHQTSQHNRSMNVGDFSIPNGEVQNQGLAALTVPLTSQQTERKGSHSPTNYSKARQDHKEFEKSEITANSVFTSAVNQTRINQDMNDNRTSCMDASHGAS